MKNQSTTDIESRRKFIKTAAAVAYVAPAVITMSASTSVAASGSGEIKMPINDEVYSDDGFGEDGPINAWGNGSKKEPDDEFINRL